jgi:hypothetical protein
MKNIVIINRAQLLGGGNNNTCTFSYTSIVDNTCIQVLQSYISRDPILKNLWLSLFINFLFISINENNWLAESMFFVGVHWMEFVSHVKFRQLQKQPHAQQRTTFVNCFSSSMIMRFSKINNNIYLFIYALVSVWMEFVSHVKFRQLQTQR